MGKNEFGEQEASASNKRLLEIERRRCQIQIKGHQSGGVAPKMTWIGERVKASQK